MLENKELMRRARGSLGGKWGLAIGTFVIYILITGGCGSIRAPGTILSLIIGGPFALGAAIFSLALARGKEPKLEQIFQGFNRFTDALVAYLLILAYVLLWTLLLVIPGIIAALSYSMTFFILVDDPAIKPADALNKSKALMQGHKLQLFYLGLRFLGLSFLCLLTLGIGFLWLIPYSHIAMAKFYDELPSLTVV